MDVFEAMGSAVSMRWLKPDPVPDELVERLIWAATRASNPGNVQPWDFVVVRDQATRRDVVQLIAARLSEIRRRASSPRLTIRLSAECSRGSGIWWIISTMRPYSSSCAGTMSTRPMPRRNT